MKMYYLNNASRHSYCNEKGLDYTPAYIPAMLSSMGATATPIPPDALDTLKEDDILLVGAERIDTIPNCRVILMGSAIGKDIEPTARVQKVFSHYINARGQALPLFVPAHTDGVEGEILAELKTVEGEVFPALVQKENLYEFRFDLAATLWFSGDGFVQEEAFFAGLKRTPDTHPLPIEFVADEALPFNDLLLGELEAILRSMGVPMLYRLAPMEDGTIPDIVLHFSGDDDCASVDLNRTSTMHMEEEGFLYHINAMAAGGGSFVFDKAVYDELNEHGCEIALHCDLTALPYSLESLKAQKERFIETFGVAPTTNVNHCLIQDGSIAEWLRWLAACDIIADNGKQGIIDPSDINAFDLCGFAFGTSFPRYTCDDAEHGNALISAMEIPMTYYEARLHTEDADTGKIVNYLDNAAAGGRITQFFFHPHYLTWEDVWPKTQRVLRVIKSHCAEKGYRILRSSTDRIALFWQARAAALLTWDESTVSLDCEQAMVLRLPAAANEVTLNGESIKVDVRTVEGAEAYLITIPAGGHWTVEIK